MSVVLDFIKTYWREILEIAALLGSVLIWLFKKKPVQVVDTFKETIIKLLPYCIIQAESAPKGEKLNSCIDILRKVLSEMGLELNDNYLSFAVGQIETILSTPQKKER